MGKTYFGLDVGLTSEQIDNTGLPNVYEYNAKIYNGDGPRTALFPPGIDFNDYLSWLSDTANEFADMVLQAHLHSGLSIDPYISFVEYQLAWFDEYYQLRNGLDKDGRLIIYPASGAETYKLALNPSSTVSGLRKTVSDLLINNPAWVKGNASYYNEYMARIPITPLQPCPGAISKYPASFCAMLSRANILTGLTCIAPASNYSFTMNSEPTAMYPVFRKLLILNHPSQ